MPGEGQQNVLGKLLSMVPENVMFAANFLGPGAKPAARARMPLGNFDANEFGFRAMADANGRPAPTGQVGISATRWSEPLDNPNAPSHGEKVLFVGNEPVGLASLYRGKNADDIRISKVDVLGSAQRNGYGRQLIDDLLAEFPGSNVTTSMRTEAGNRLFAPYDSGDGLLKSRQR
jgi:hypothetical protein